MNICEDEPGVPLQRPAPPPYAPERLCRVSHDDNQWDKTTTRRNLLRATELNCHWRYRLEATMNGLIYLVGLVVVIMFILSFLGLR